MGNKILQFEGDIRMFSIHPTTGVETPVLPSDTDAFGNTPVEASASVFQYEAGELLEVKSKRRNRYNQIIHSEQQPGTSTLSLTLVAIPPPLLARVFYGEAAETSVTGDSVVDEVITFVATTGIQQALAHSHITAASVVVQDVTDTTTYVEGTDYTIDYTAGRIVRLEDGDIGATDVVHIDYDYDSYTLTTIRGGVQPQQTFRITGDMLNRPDLQDMQMEIYEANLSTDGDVDLFSSEPITITLTGPLITPDDKDEPYIVRAYEVTA